MVGGCKQSNKNMFSEGEEVDEGNQQFRLNCKKKKQQNTKTTKTFQINKNPHTIIDSKDVRFQITQPRRA